MRRRRFLGSLAAGACTAVLPRRAPAAVFSADAFNGFWMPEEAVRHERTFMQWPVNPAAYEGQRHLEETQRVIALIANTIAAFEPVVMLMAAAHAPAARRWLGGTVEIWPIPTDDLWARDSGPIFVVNAAGAQAVVDINFNGWGNRWPHAADALVSARVAERLGLPLLESGVVGEGGGVETDGDGTLLAHESSWVNRNRNRLPRAEIERRLLAALGAETMIWAPGLRGLDVTDAHIDGLARFVAPGVVLIQLPEQIRPGDPWSASALETYDILAEATDARGRRLNLIVVPDARAASLSSYANFYVCNGAVLFSMLGEPQADAKAESIIADLYPDREIIGLETGRLGELGGGIHCATQQQPAVRSACCRFG